ncbi:uncharacterized protein LOC117652659 [Thrips palmi]|uniref:Uncharacterized protein LOC117652659 n=1 Tax=Thrips palmi TaxID=161013 RepID=A0A6P9A6N6_THRPL|nr:uncharacterized protein LOC117652659 [Thrips palmi]
MDANLLFYCKFCSNKSKSIKSHLHHLRVHRHLTRLTYCGLGHCLSAFRSESSFRAHVIRNHRIFVSKGHNKPSLPPSSTGKYKCPIAICGREFLVYKLLTSHLRVHLREFSSIPCVVDGCLKKFSSINSLSGHISKKHRQQTTIDHEVITSPVYDLPEISLDEYCAPEEEVTQQERKEESLVALAQFHQKLEFKHMVPASVNQVISKEIRTLLSSMERCFLNSLSSILQDENLSPETISLILSSVSERNDLLEVCHSLRSVYMRKQFYERHFNFVVPEKVPLDNGSFYYYIPIKKTIRAAFANKSFNFDFELQTSQFEGVFRDFFDGETYKSYKFFQDNPKAIPIILYQDGFELANPIGPAKNLKHKLLGVYMAFGNLPSDIRFKKENIQLVALVKDCDFNPTEVYSKIVEDLISLQETGIEVDGHGTVKASLAFIAGDNLGSHALAGLVENFSRSKYFCRYCLMSRAEFRREGGETRKFPRRTIDSYNEDLERVADSNGRLGNHRGVKYDSPFNAIPGFHVCAPALPCCIGHDLGQGVISWDLKLFIQYFVAEGWFDIETLNDLIEAFPYSAEDRKDKPCIIKKLEKGRLAGGAWQLITFMRLFPLIVSGHIKNPRDKVWKLMLLLREITLFSIAPKVHESHLPSFQCMIDEYLMLRRALFPHKLLRPKHHYLSHFPELILLFGCLIKVWTLRFETKHSFFVRSWKSSNNSINMPQTLAFKHEFLQSWVRSGGSSVCTVQSGESVPYQHVLYSEAIQKAVEKCVHSFSQFVETNSLSVHGTNYRKGDVVVVRHVPRSNDLIVGMIHLMLLGPNDDVTFLVKLCKASLVHKYGCYKVQALRDFECCRQVDLLCFYPMHPYLRDTQTYISLRHAIVNSPCNSSF